MAEGLFITLGLLAAMSGMAALALSLEANWHLAAAPRRYPSERTKYLRGTGAGLLVAALVACLLANHVSLAWFVWFMLLALAQVLVALLLAVRPRALGWLARILGGR